MKYACFLNQKCDNERMSQRDMNCRAFKLLCEPVPSNTILTKCFLVYFEQNRLAYERYMMSLTASQYISLDHTFKIASNIYVRGDGHWVTQYSSLLFVLNEVGQVLTWQLTCTTSLDEVRPVLDSLAVRFRKQGVMVPLVLVDNWCNACNKIQSVFVNMCAFVLTFSMQFRECHESYLNFILCITCV